jgi:hypothetical protein
VGQVDELRSLLGLVAAVGHMQKAPLGVGAHTRHGEEVGEVFRIRRRTLSSYSVGGGEKEERDIDVM